MLSGSTTWTVTKAIVKSQVGFDEESQAAASDSAAKAAHTVRQFPTRVIAAAKNLVRGGEYVPEGYRDTAAAMREKYHLPPKVPATSEYLEVMKEIQAVRDSLEMQIEWRRHDKFYLFFNEKAFAIKQKKYLVLDDLCEVRDQVDLIDRADKTRKRPDFDDIISGVISKRTRRIFEKISKLPAAASPKAQSTQTC